MAKQQIGSRVFMGLTTTGVLAMTLWGPSATQYIDTHIPTLTTISALTMWAYQSVLGFLVLLVLSDVVVNDLMPPKYSLKVNSHYRQLAWMLISISLVGLSYVHFHFTNDHWTWAWLLFFGVQCVNVALIDLLHELQHKRKERYERPLLAAVGASSAGGAYERLRGGRHA